MAGADGVQGSNIYVNWRMDTPPNVVGAAQSFAIAPGTNLLFSAGISNKVTSPTYQWQLNGLIIAGAANATCSLTNIQYIYTLATNFSGVDGLHFLRGVSAVEPEALRGVASCQ